MLQYISVLAELSAQQEFELAGTIGRNPLQSLFGTYPPLDFCSTINIHVILRVIAKRLKGGLFIFYCMHLSVFFKL